MSNAVAPEDLKAAYAAGMQAPRQELSIAILSEKCKFEKAKSSQILQHLVKLRLAAPPHQNERGEIVATVRETQLATRLRNIKSPAYEAFCSIESSGGRGMGAPEITRAINDKKLGASVTSQAITKAIKELEAEKVIKLIRSIQNTKKKLYIVANREADTSVVGGVFYKDGIFNDELVESYRNSIMDFVRAKGASSKLNVVKHLRGSGFTVDLGEADLDRVFQTLIWDQQLVQTIQKNTGDIVFSLDRYPNFENFEVIPCTSCPHYDCCQIEDLDRFDAVMLRQPLTQAAKNRESKARVGAGESRAASRVLEMLGDDGLPLAVVANFTSKVNPSTCPYFSQWLGLTGFEPTVPRPENDAQEVED